MEKTIITESICTGPLFVNTYIVHKEGEKKCVVIDPADGDKVLNYLNKKSLECEAVLITHCHFDHILGVPEMQRAGAKVYIGEKDEPGLRDEMINQCYKKVEHCTADVMLKEGDTVEEAGLRFEVLETPGHTMGGVSYVLREAGEIFSGDTIFYRSVGRTDLYGGSETELEISVADKLFALEGDFKVMPGHGPATRLSEERRENPYIKQG